MPLGIVSNEDFESALNDSIKAPEIKIEIEKGRGKGTTEVPELIREIVSEDAIQNGNQSALNEGLAKFFQVSASSVSAYKNDATSTKTYHEPNKDLKKSNNRVKKVIVGKARRVMQASLDAITDDKLEGSKATDLSVIARNMAGIIRDMEPAEKKEVSQAAQIVIYKPQMQFNENNYETVHLPE